MFSVHTAAEEFENATIAGYLDLCLRKTGSGKSRDYRDVIVFEKFCLQNVFLPNENETLAFSNSVS